MRWIHAILISTFCWLTPSCNPKGMSDETNNEKTTNMRAPFYSHEIPMNHPRVSKNYDTSKIEKFYPFIVYKDDSYMIAAEIEHPDLLEKYGSIFAKYGFTGNGYSWEGNILQMIEKEQPEMLQHLFFDPEAGGFYVFADNEKNQKHFAEFASRIFAETDRLEQYLKTADRNKVDD